MADELLRTYHYTAVAPDGARRKGKMEADSQQVVVTALQAEGLVPISVEEQKKSLLNLTIIKPRSERDFKLAPEDILVFSRQLYLLLRAGLSIHRAVGVIGEEHPDKRYVRMCADISEMVLSGVPLSKAMALYPRVFDDVYCSYVAAGESTGDMEKALARLTRVLNQAHQLRLKVKAVTAYPKMVSFAVMFLVYGILKFLVPMYAKIYEGFGQQLPGPTLFVVRISEIIEPINISIGFLPPSIDLIPDDQTLLTAPLNLVSPIFWIGAAIFAWVTFRRRTKDNLRIGTAVEKVKYKIPLLGKLFKSAVLYRWSSTMAGALQAGLQTYSALELAGKTAGSAWVRQVTLDMQEAVRSGRQLSSELSKHPDLFNAQLRAMAATGEEAGEAAEMFEGVSVALEDELEAMVAVLGARLEVVLLAVMGGVVGSLLVVLYLPILSLSRVAGQGYGADV